MRRTAFTLVELLIVIAVIAVLMGILVPVLRTAKEQARGVACGSNLKQLSLAMTVYGQENETFPYGFDYHGMVKPPRGYVGNAIYDKMGWWWFHFLANIVEQDFAEGTTLWCPSRRIKDPLPKQNVLCGNYGVNRAICKDASGFADSEFVGRPLGIDQIRHSAQTLLIADSGYSLISWRGASNASGPYFDNPRREDAFYIPGLLRINNQRILEGTISRGCELDAIDGRHLNKTVNVIFADSHLTRVKADELFVEEINGNYSNRSPLWLSK